MPRSKTEFLEWWETYESETAYFIRKDLIECMYGPRSSLSGHWIERGYVPRVYGSASMVEVGDLL